VELKPVESSNIAAIGYAEGYNLLRVQFRDGSVYDYPGVSPEKHAGLMDSESKGHYLADCIGKGTRIDWKPIGGEKPISAAIRSEETKRLQSHVEDECCDGPLNRALRSGSLDTAESWTCPKCGENWKPELIGDLRHWTPRPLVAVF
jgi:hypothetical protein